MAPILLPRPLMREVITEVNPSFSIVLLHRLQHVLYMLCFRRYPVLLQGETSVGKTSLINWLAQASGNMCVRINNHDHTDLQEYLGCYAADETGKLVFQEGNKSENRLFTLHS